MEQICRQGVSGTRRLAATVLLLTLGLVGAAGLATAETFTARVVGVTDGDTLRVRGDGPQLILRLRGIDAPEKGQAYGQRAKEYLSGLAFGQTVTVQATGRDRYGRLLAEVLLPDGRSVGQELVRAGYAWWYRRYSRDPTLARLEGQAREAHRGLWADPHPVAPWAYRHPRASARVAGSGRHS
jgi:endonuclease YncB( thermonuclease family)